MAAATPAEEGVPPPRTDSSNQCVVCFERPAGSKLACGHAHFCNVCAARFRTCPLCRAPCVISLEPQAAPQAAVGDDITAREQEEDHQQLSVLNHGEVKAIIGVCAFVWLFIFVGGWIEWSHEIPGLVVGDGHVDAACVESFGKFCSECAEGWLQAGRGCFEHLEDLPPVVAGAALSPSFYFGLIVTTQLIGITCEICLIRRVRSILPTKEKVILGTALCIELLRMLLIDVFVLRDYFGGGAYQIFRAPASCGTLHSDNSSWLGADSQLHCNPAAAAAAAAPMHANHSDDVMMGDPSQDRDADSLYYIATHREAYTHDLDECSLFTADSALLDLDETSGTWGTGGHPRFSRIGWVIGGEFALYYFFATFINEMADCMFVIPTTTAGGWKCKVFSVALEFAQLGALAPAAIFEHNACLHYTNPLGVPISVIRDVIIPFGYALWSFVLCCIPLGLIGFALVFVTWALGRGCGGCVKCATKFYPRCGTMLTASQECSKKLASYWQAGTRSTCQSFLVMAFLPLLLGGMFLGTLVVVGQGSKHGAMQILTAIVLLSDVIFKVGATVITEALEYALHVRVRRVIALRDCPARSHTKGSAQGDKQRLELQHVP